jgi:hypothetical protein
MVGKWGLNGGQVFYAYNISVNVDEDEEIRGRLDNKNG